jgi:hypothetical protein
MEQIVLALDHFFPTHVHVTLESIALLELEQVVLLMLPNRQPRALIVLLDVMARQQA